QVASSHAGALEIRPDLRRDVHGHITLGISQRVQDSNECGANVVIGGSVVGEVEVQTGGTQIDGLHVTAGADTGSANALVGDIATIEERAHDLTADSANAGSLIVCDLVEADAALTFQLTPLDAELRGVNQYQGAVVVVGTAIHRLPMLSVKAGLRLELAVIAAVHARQHAHMNRASQRHEVGQQTGYATVGQHQLSGLAVDLGPQARVHLGGVGGGAHQPVNHHLV